MTPALTLISIQIFINSKKGKTIPKQVIKKSIWQEKSPPSSYNCIQKPLLY